MKYTALLLLLIIPGVVYAEEATIQVPFESHGTSCWYDEEIILYHCTWQGEREIFTIQDLEQFKEYLSEEVYQEELDRLTYVEPVTEPILTDNEKLVIKLENKLDSGVATASDSVLFHLLQSLEQCNQGLGNSAAIQTERSFTISSYTYGASNNVEIKGQMGELLKAIQECHAQQKLENTVLSVAYSNMANGENDVTFDHYGSFEGISAIPYEQYTKSDFKVDTNVICDSHAYPQSYKDTMGCPPIQYDGFTYPEGSGFISYYSPIIEEYAFFMQDYGDRKASEHAKQVQAGIAQPIADSMIEDNLFYQNHKE